MTEISMKGERNTLILEWAAQTYVVLHRDMETLVQISSIKPGNNKAKTTYNFS